MAVKALQEANLSFTENSDNAAFGFGNAATAANPVYQFNQQRLDIDYADGAFVGYLNSLTDPRLLKYITPDYSDVNGAGISDRYGAISAPVEFITFEEMQFVKAEAELRSNGDYATAQVYFQDGIRASMEKLGVSQNDADIYIAANGILPVTGINDAIAKVSLQEYLALYLNPESFTLWRRTGEPALTPISGTNGIPRRFLYPQSEFSLNSANVPQATLYSPKIFWDK